MQLQHRGWPDFGSDSGVLLIIGRRYHRRPGQAAPGRRLYVVAMTRSTARSIAIAVGGIGAGLAVFVASPRAVAAPPCTAAALADRVSSVSAQAARFLEAHPDANDALTQAGSQSPEDARASLRSYFFSHPDQYFQLQTIAQPLNDMRAQCNSNLSIGQIAQLVDAVRE
jgi:hemophore-related protein